MARTKGTLNRTTIGRMQRDSGGVLAHVDNGAKPVPPPRRVEQLDAYIELQKVARIHLGLAASEQQRGDGMNKKVFVEHLRDAQGVLRDLIPYQRPRLARVTLERGTLDLSRLTDEQLLVFEQLFAIVSSANPGGDPGGAASPAGG